jgi:proteic killer suppression protein
MIKSFKHKDLEIFFLTGSKEGIQALHAKKLQILLTTLSNARDEGDMRAPAWSIHPLSGNLDKHWSVSVNGNWRMTFRFEGKDAVLVNYQDYH